MTMNGSVKQEDGTVVMTNGTFGLLQMLTQAEEERNMSAISNGKEVEFLPILDAKKSGKMRYPPGSLVVVCRGYDPQVDLNDGDSETSPKTTSKALTSLTRTHVIHAKVCQVGINCSEGSNYETLYKIEPYWSGEVSSSDRVFLVKEDAVVFAPGCPVWLSQNSKKTGQHQLEPAVVLGSQHLQQNQLLETSVKTEYCGEILFPSVLYSVQKTAGDFVIYHDVLPQDIKYRSSQPPPKKSHVKTEYIIADLEPVISKQVKTKTEDLENIHLNTGTSAHPVLVADNDIGEELVVSNGTTITNDDNNKEMFKPKEIEHASEADDSVVQKKRGYPAQEMDSFLHIPALNTITVMPATNSRHDPLGSPTENSSCSATVSSPTPTKAPAKVSPDTPCRHTVLPSASELRRKMCPKKHSSKTANPVAALPQPALTLAVQNGTENIGISREVSVRHRSLLGCCTIDGESKIEQYMTKVGEKWTRGNKADRSGSSKHIVVTNTNPPRFQSITFGKNHDVKSAIGQLSQPRDGLGRGDIRQVANVRCLSWHLLGKCHADCSRQRDHGQLNTGDIRVLENALVAVTGKAGPIYGRPATAQLPDRIPRKTERLSSSSSTGGKSISQPQNKGSLPPSMSFQRADLNTIPQHTAPPQKKQRSHY